MLVLKLNDNATMSWMVVFIPFWVMLVVCAVDVLRIIALGYKSRISIEKIHIMQLLILCAAIYFGFLSTFRICNVSAAGDTKKEVRESINSLTLLKEPWILWLLSIWCLYLSLAITYISSCVNRANCRGYNTPLQVDKTRNGWEAVPEPFQQRPSVFVISTV